MFREIFLFEVRHQLRQPIFWIGVAFFFLLTFLAVTTDAVVIGGSIGNVDRNAPFVILQLLGVMSVLGVFVTTAFVAGSVLRDSDLRTQELFFTAPLKKRDYLLGRFTGALTVACLFFVPVALAILLGGFMPWLDPERVGPVRLAPYLATLGIVVWPNILLTASLFFSLATWTRSMLGTYTGLVGMFVGYLVAGSLLSDVENEKLAAVFDPFAGAAIDIATKYWTVAEKNTLSVSLDGPLLLNRLVWVGVALAVLAVTYWRFSLQSAVARRPRRLRLILRRGGGWAARLKEEVTAARSALAVRTTASARQVFTLRTRFDQLVHQTWFEVRAVFKSLAFPVILALGVVNIFGNSNAVDQLFGTPVYPVTNLMVRILLSASLFVIIILTFYAGEMVWRERSLGLDEVHDALPVPNAVLWGSKLIALGGILAAVLLTSIATGIAIQAFRGYTHFELGLYAQGILLVAGVPFLLMAVLSLFLQVATHHKYAGFLLMILYFISGPALGALGFEHNLYRYASPNDAPYSDMNGWGPFAPQLFWYYLYWSAGALLLGVLIHLFWVRGKDTGWRTRLRLAAQRFTPPVKAFAALGLVAFAALGGWIFTNTNVRNDYIPDDLREERQAQYEARYKRYEGLAQPRITAVWAEVDLYPERRAVDIRGTYTLRNKTGEPIEKIHLSVPARLEVRRIDLAGATPELEDRELGYAVYRLAEPLAPGAEMTMGFDVGVAYHGFTNSDADTHVVGNGTFINNFDYFPSLGYNRGAELEDPNDRRKHGLPPIQRMPALENRAARWANYITAESDWIDFETVVSTRPDQIALAPGYLQREWTENGRRYFHYKMDAPILGFFAYLSADWEVARDTWNDVAIEIYYHRDHAFNVGRMIEAVKKSLDVFTTEFGPYQHRQVRILEFPRYERFAQSFPNTIPFSEAIGFIARLDDDPEAIDYVFYVTAHEMAHQWWAHQVIGGNVQGATVLTETMSQYSALLVMEREYGRDQMRRFLKYELDSYLRNRGGELVEELPLLRVENQGYIHYRKGSVVMYALKDYLGEENLNRAIRRFLEAHKFQKPPYTTSQELVDFIRAEVPPERRGILEDLFEKITLYENRVAEARWRRREDGRYEVRLAVEARKFHADGEGVESEVPVDDWIDVGVFGEQNGGPAPGEVLAMEKRRLTANEEEIVLVVDEEPRRAGIDPYNKLIDRNPDDNLTAVTEAAGG